MGIEKSKYKQEKEIFKISAIEAIIKKALVCRLGLSDEENPYIVPLSFGYQDKTLYFHSAAKGKKIDIMRKNPRVCFEIDINSEIIKAEDECKWGMRYQSVIGYGKAVLLQSADEKRRALKIIMSQYSDRQYHFIDKEIQKTAVIKVEIEDMTGRQSPLNFVKISRELKKH
jgi:nitroimidazol reductase NimA-like FMN-containing flavoprotein (pyridoxamine 5'-phosphate oxidase superfamily)